MVPMRDVRGRHKNKEVVVRRKGDTEVLEIRSDVRDKECNGWLSKGDLLDGA
jgi:hypothetical protein